VTVGHSRIEGTYCLDLDPVDEATGSSGRSGAHGPSTKKAKFQNSAL